ncbi:M23 family metallopeptidase [Streptomyces avicenniae]|uniref:M23 family metallopeptidase n=1 Tax=Streptomyces avicenniae TaxID=500153 RepID=UPI000699DAF7|nr:M23 family metallopeptidase [Streptomyces avicenniae]
MPNSTTIRSLTHMRLRSRAGVALATGLVASAGVTGALAADGGTAEAAPHIDTAATASGLADSTGAQADAQHKAATTWTDPIGGDYDLTATYGNSGDRWAHKHSGQDFAVDVGTEVQAVHGGTVVKAGGNGAGDGPAYGNAVVVQHDDDTYTQYAHLDAIHVKPGDKVTTGQEIAASGNTGNSSGPHLHFEVRSTPDYGSAVDPMPFLHEHDVNA